MILAAIAARPYLQSSYENFSNGSEDPNSILGFSVGFLLFMIIFGLISAYGAARLSYFYNMNTGNSSWALFYSVLAFLFSDFYYPMYSFFLNPLSAKSRNNIPLPGGM
jgi:hypothetical protein